MEKTIIKPQEGKQELFLSSTADVTVFGGAAGGGKTYGLLLESVRFVGIPEYRGVIFRRTSKQIMQQGGLWDTASSLYPILGGEPNSSKLSWKFPSGAVIQFSHLEYDKNVFDHDGSQYAFIGFDELQHFTEYQFFYLLSRNRTLCNIKPYIRATCNPKPDSWLSEILDWWIDEDGYAIEERGGKVRYFIRRNNEIRWVDKDYRDEIGNPPKSFTFIPSKVTDNKILIERDPEYISNLNALPEIDRLRLREGNWKINENDGLFRFVREWKFIDCKDLPKRLRTVRYWDCAGTEPSEKNKNPAYTAGAKVGLDIDDIFYIIDMVRFQHAPLDTEKTIKQTAEMDGRGVTVWIEQEPGSSGKSLIDYYQRKVLRGFPVRGDKPSGDKITRAKPWAALAERGNIRIVRGHWNKEFLKEVGSFPFGQFKDQVDAVSGGYNALFNKTEIKSVDFNLD